MDVSNIDDVIRLLPQYDASGFLQKCTPSKQYRILAGICRNENYFLTPEKSGERMENKKNLDNVPGFLFLQQYKGIPDICYSSNLLAFMSSCGQKTAPLSMFKAGEEERKKRKEEEQKAEEREKMLQLEAQKQQEEEQKEENMTTKQELWYDEEGGYYYDNNGYYDEEGNYYYFDMQDETEQVLESEQDVRAEEKKAQTISTCSEEQFETAEQGNLADNTDAPLLNYTRVPPKERQWVNSRFSSANLLQKVSSKLERSLPPVDVFLRDACACASMPISLAVDVYSSEKGGVEVLSSSCIHVLASINYLHIVYVPLTGLAEQRLGEVDAEELSKMLLDCPSQVDVLMSIPLFKLDENHTAFCASLGKGRVLFEFHVTQEETESEEDNGLTVSMVFGVSSDSTFLSVPSVSCLLQCYEQRVLHHLINKGCVFDPSFAAAVENTINCGSHTTTPSLPLFSYSASLIACDTNNRDVEQNLIYDEVNNSLFLQEEHKAAELERCVRGDAFYLMRNMEPPRWRFFREALEALQKTEAERRAELCAAAMSPYSPGPNLSFYTIAFVQLPFLHAHEMAVKGIFLGEQQQWEHLISDFTNGHKITVTKETRRRLAEQFSFERRLLLLQCSVNTERLVENEAAARMAVERDEAQMRVEFSLAGRWGRLQPAL